MSLDRTFAAVIFDLDSTLVDSNDSLVAAWTTWAIEYGITAGQLADWHGHSSREIVAALVPTDAEASHARIDDLEVEHAVSVRSLPGSADALAALPEGLVAIATSGTTRIATARLAAAGLTPPAVLVTADDVVRSKPDPEIFRLAARRLGQDPADCLVVEDSVAGITAARAAGCTTLAVLTTTPRERLLADAHVPDLSHARFEVADGRVRVALTAG